jgi:mRNA interferase RelE/StbE
MTYRINLLSSSQEDLSHLDATVTKRIFLRLKWLSDNAQNITPKTLHGKLQGLYKLRAGNYRIIYDINHTDRLIRVHFIGHRKDIYKTK